MHLGVQRISPAICIDNKRMVLISVLFISFFIMSVTTISKF